MSSGRVCSVLLSFSLPFLSLPFLDLLKDGPGSVIPVPRVAGTKSSFAMSLMLFSGGVRKSILNASFFSLRALGADSATSAVSEK